MASPTRHPAHRGAKSESPNPIGALSNWSNPLFGGGLVNPLKKEILIATKGSINGMTAYKRLFDSSCAFKNEDFANDYNNAQNTYRIGFIIAEIPSQLIGPSTIWLLFCTQITHSAL